MNKERSSDERGAYEKKRDSGSVQGTKLSPSPTEVLKDEEKIFSRLTRVADLLESLQVPSTKAKRTKGDRRHFQERIRDAEGFQERDKLLRDLVSMCYGEGRKFAELGDVDTQIQWLKLLLRFLRFSQQVSADGKADQDLQEIRKAIAELKENRGQ